MFRTGFVIGLICGFIYVRLQPDPEPVQVIGDYWRYA